jgi:adenylate kinase
LNSNAFQANTGGRMHPISHEPLTIVLLGPPGSGKGTQASQLSIVLGIPAISSGDMMRAECSSGSALGRSVKAILDAGRLIDDQVMNEVVAARLNRSDCRNGFILDGYPRTVQQAQFLNGLLRAQKIPEPTVVHLDVNVDEIRSRLSRRLQCPACGAITSLPQTSVQAPQFCAKDGTLLFRRTDDCQEDAVLERVRIYNAMIDGLIAFYRNRSYYRLAGTRPADDITSDILTIVQPRHNVVLAGTRAVVRAEAVA